MKTSSPPAGYDFIPLADRVERQARPSHVAHDRRHEHAHSGILHLTWLAEQPIHICSGFKRLAGERTQRVVVREHVRLGDIPCIPGSSLKGVLRARFEAITRSCVAAPRPPNKPMQVRSATYGKHGFRKATLLPQALQGIGQPCRGPDQLCPACALFGALNLRSRLTITDALPTVATLEQARIPEQFTPNLHHIGHFRANDATKHLELGHLHGRKFAVGRDERPPPSDYRRPSTQKQILEVLPSGTRLHSELRFVNLTTAELGGLQVALGLTPRSRLKIGAGKCHGLGRLFLVTSAAMPRRAGEPLPDHDACHLAFTTSSACQSQHLDRLVTLHGEDC